MEIRAVTDRDIPTVLDLNEESVASLSPMDAAAFAAYRALTPHVLVCEADATVAGFALAFPPGTAYGSINYAWHAERFDDFLYLDRIAVSSSSRRRGIAGLLYDAMEAAATPHGRMVCEIYTDNQASIAFHVARGYRTIGHLMQATGHETVMMEKPL